MRGQLLVLAIVGTLVVTGCSDSTAAPAGPPTVPSTPTPTVAPPSSTPVNEPKPLTVYRAHWDVLSAAYQNPDPDRWGPRLAEVMTAPALTLAVDQLYGMREDGVTRQGPITISPRLETGDDGRAVIEDCIDISELSIMQRGEPVELAPDQLLRYKLTAVVLDTPEGWRVSELRPHREQPC